MRQVSLQRKAAPAPPTRVPTSARGSGPATGGVHPAVLRPSTGGSPLPAPVQAKMEAALGHDFASVRVHHGPEASSIGARAFARGSHLHFAPGEYRPHSAAGQRILAHELTHVVQQRAGRVAHPGGAVPINDEARLEGEADRIAARAAAGEAVSLPHAGGEMAPPTGTLQLATDDEASDDDSDDKKEEDKEDGEDAREEMAQEGADSELAFADFGAGQSHKLLNLPVDRVKAAPPKTPGRSSKLFSGSKYLHEKRAYGDEERPAQSLRWISTTLHSHLSSQTKQSVPEVQASLAGDSLIVSSNSNAHNDTLRKTLAGPKAREVLSTIVKTGTKAGKAKKAQFQGRYKRHTRKLENRLLGSETAAGFEDMSKALAKPIIVPGDVEPEMDGLHAERRIKRHLGDAFEDATTRGTMRPCGVCNQELYAGAGGTGNHPQHAGPLWDSGAATRGVTVNDAYKRELRHVPSHASLTRHGGKEHIHFEYDTDSDTDAESGGEAAAAASASLGKRETMVRKKKVEEKEKAEDRERAKKPRRERDEDDSDG